MDFAIQINTIEMGSIYFKGSQVESGACIKGLFYSQKTENCFSPISFDWFIRIITEV